MKNKKLNPPKSYPRPTNPNFFRPCYRKQRYSYFRPNEESLTLKCTPRYLFILGGRANVNTLITEVWPSLWWTWDSAHGLWLNMGISILLRPAIFRSCGLQDFVNNITFPYCTSSLYESHLYSQKTHTHTKTCEM